MYVSSFHLSRFHSTFNIYNFSYTCSLIEISFKTEMDLIWILFLVIGVIILLRYLAIRDAKYFESRGIFYLGNNIYSLVSSTLKGQSMIEMITSQYNFVKSNNAKLAASKDLGMFTIMINDLDIVKHVLVKDADHFVNRRPFTTPKNDPLLSKMLFIMKDEQWKSLRSKMSPTFTTGKIRRMFKIFDESGKKLVKYLQQQMERSDGQIDLTEGYSKYTMDVIASAAFGIDSQALSQVEPSVFEKMGHKIQFQFGGLNLFKFMVTFLFPKLSDMFGWSFMAKDAQQFFSSAIKSTIKHRETSGEKRDDFIQLMLEARTGQLKTEETELSDFEKDAQVKEDDSKNTVVLDDDCIVANCVLFVLGGFDTTKSLLIFAAYALALNPDVQDKLRDEIIETLESNDGKFTYDAVNGMQYMEQFINETLRFYPPAPVTDRSCTKDYKFPDSDIVITKGENIGILTYGIHHDERYYSEPEKFDPERFSPKNRSKINSYAFLPFGHGPRNCIGMRFALIEVKLAIAHLVHNFTIMPSEKTLIPMKFQTSASLKPVGGMWLALHKRN